MEQTKTAGRARYLNSTRIAVISIFSAIATILYILKFSLPIFPSWLEINLSDIPALIGTFALGPLSGAIIVGVKILLELLLTGTSTMFVGDFADLLLGCALVVPAGLIYKYHRTFKGAIVGLIVGSVCSTAVGILANWLVLVPLYLQLFFGGNWNVMLGIMSELFRTNVTVENFFTYYLWCAVLPFNALRCLIAALVVLPVYKHISVVINKLNAKLSPKTERTEEQTRKTNIKVIIILAVILLAVVAAILLRYFLYDAI